MTPGRYLPLLQDLDRWQAETISEHPHVIPCRLGCSACCLGPFDISVADVAVVVDAVRSLEPEVRSAVVARAAADLAEMLRLEPAWREPFDIAEIGDERFDRISEALATRPCPLLDAGGGCLIYRSRPMVCRLMGGGLVTESGDVIENGCPIQADYPAYATLAPRPFPLEAWEVREEAEKTIAAERMFGEGEMAEFETTIAAAIVTWVARNTPGDGSTAGPSSQP